MGKAIEQSLLPKSPHVEKKTPLGFLDNTQPPIAGSPSTFAYQRASVDVKPVSSYQHVPLQQETQI